MAVCVHRLPEAGRATAWIVVHVISLCIRYLWRLLLLGGSFPLSLGEEVKKILVGEDDFNELSVDVPLRHESIQEVRRNRGFGERLLGDCHGGHSGGESVGVGRVLGSVRL